MKRISSLLLALSLLLGLAACGGEAPAETPADTYAVEAMALTDAMAAVLKDVPDLPDYEITELTEENFEFFTFLPYAEGDSAVAADALIGSTPHSVVLVRVPDGAADAEQTIRSGADPRKWICVEAEKTVVRRYGDTILLVMSQAETANAILTNFDALNGVETPAADLEIPPREPEEVPDDVVVVPDDQLNAPAAPGEPADMPALAPEDGADDNMPVLDPGDDAVELPTVEPAPAEPVAPTPPVAPDPVPVPPVEQPAEPPVTEVPAPEAPAAETDLAAVMDAILAGVELPSVSSAELTADTFEFFAFLPYADGYRGLVSEAMMSAVAHSVVLVEVPEGADAAQAAAAMQSNADPRKWICVEAESVQTASKGRLALLVMSDQATADAIIANFTSGSFS